MRPRVLLRMSAGEIDATLTPSRCEGAARVANVEGEKIIRRPVEEVFDFVADDYNESRYNRRMVRVEKISPRPWSEAMWLEGRPLRLMVIPRVAVSGAAAAHRGPGFRHQPTDVSALRSALRSALVRSGLRSTCRMSRTSRERSVRTTCVPECWVVAATAATGVAASASAAIDPAMAMVRDLIGSSLSRGPRLEGDGVGLTLVSVNRSVKSAVSDGSKAPYPSDFACTSTYRESR